MKVVGQAFMILGLLTLAKAAKSTPDKDVEVTKTYIVPWYCKNESKVNFIHFGASIEKEAELSYKFRGIGHKIKDALECGRKCLDSGTAGFCATTRVTSVSAKRKRRHSSSYPQVDLQRVLNIDPAKTKPSIRATDATIPPNVVVKKCDKKEMACYVLFGLWKSPESAPAPYTKSSAYSQPQCKVYKKRLTWIMHKEKWCKVVQPHNETWIQTAWCDYKPCCANKYKIWPLTECRPSGWTKVTFCVYCPDISLLGVMDIVTRYLPNSCSCANNMCANPAEKHKGSVKEGSYGNEPYKAGSDIHPPVKEGSKPVTERPYIQEPVKESPQVNKPVKEGPYVLEPVKEGSYVHEQEKEGFNFHEPSRAGSNINEPVKEGYYTNEPVKEEPSNPVLPESRYRGRYYWDRYRLHGSRS